jgi:hypothetical protein
VARMRRGAVIADISIDAGGVAETSRPTTHAEPRSSRRASSITASATFRRRRPRKPPRLVRRALSRT